MSAKDRKARAAERQMNDRDRMLSRCKRMVIRVRVQNSSTPDDLLDAFLSWLAERDDGFFRWTKHKQPSEVFRFYCWHHQPKRFAVACVLAGQPYGDTMYSRVKTLPKE